MSKNLKVNVNIKLEIVKRAIYGEPYLKLAQEYFPKCNKYSKDGSIRKWVKSYQSGGIDLLGKGAGRSASKNKARRIDCSCYRIVPQYLSKRLITNPTDKQIAMIKKIKSMPKNERYKYIQRIAQRNPHKFAITMLCNIFAVSRQIYYWYLNYESKPKKQSERSSHLQKLILKVYHHNEGVYGYERIAKILRRDFGENVSAKCVYYHMKKLGIKSIIRVKTNRAIEVKNTKNGYKDLIKRNFKAIKANEKWFTDITYVQIKGGWAFLSAIIDVYDKSIVAYHFGKANNVDLVMKTLRKAIKNRVANNVILHTDHGFQYTSKEYVKLLKTNKITPSMGRISNSLDNQPIEAFWGIIKTECLYIKKTSALTFEATSKIIDKFMIKYRDYRP